METTRTLIDVSSPCFQRYSAKLYWLIVKNFIWNPQTKSKSCFILIWFVWSSSIFISLLHRFDGNNNLSLNRQTKRSEKKKSKEKFRAQEGTGEKQNENKTNIQFEIYNKFIDDEHYYYHWFYSFIITFSSEGITVYHLPSIQLNGKRFGRFNSTTLLDVSIIIIWTHEP